MTEGIERKRKVKILKDTEQEPGVETSGEAEHHPLMPARSE